MQHMGVEREFEFTDEDFRFIADWSYSRTGIVLHEHKADMVYSRLARRLRSLGLTSVSDYCSYLQSDKGGDEIGHLVNAITTNLTSFFREAHHFEHLRKEVLEPFSAQKSARLRIWSAGCSAGAEPYCIAMMMAETIPQLSQRDCKILATDIDTNMLEKGHKGEYTEDWVEKIPPNLRMKYTEAVAGRASEKRMVQALRDLIAFKPLNLLESWPMQGKFDAIFCRNVVIYFDKPTQKILFNRYADKLVEGGFLYIGHSETLNNLTDRFALVDKTTYQKIK